MSKRKFNEKHNNLMDLLDQVPGVIEHMNSFEVTMGKKIFQRRLELGLTQSQLVEIILQGGDKITQATISKVECGDNTIGSDTYNKIFFALGGLRDIEIKFGEYPKRPRREPVFT
ncbi:helix-turn-helix domain-containing protein [Bacillus sp. ISL-7]|uniref:helix-turn-helix domain-containing protein n=1 Tax=Bacillus sp. ISL-7 TaxID=2819136 RepID=UPI001BE68AFD|nr:helix-turn-helix transcriptional regulator [Bacillus sp. ISL-7]MBT2734119.1 helix-turn-helix transcriptional regulator [Bacillus sp. ISL-7]